MSSHKSLRGADLHSPSTEQVENNTGSTIPKFRAVTFNAIGTVYPEITLGNGTLDLIRGVTQSDIPTGKTGYVTALGFLNQVDTSSWVAGTKLYAQHLGVISELVSGLPVGVVLKQDAVNGVVYIENTGITKGDLESLEFPDALSLELAWTPNNPSFYTEPTYNMGGFITRVDIWDSPGKSFHIFEKVFTYNMMDQVTQVVVTRLYDSIAITKQITYNLDGSVQNVTRTYTP